MKMIDQLIKKLGKEKVSASESELYRHSRDESSHPPVTPDVVCFPESREDVQQIVRFANQSRIPVTPFGAGSGLEGQVIPVCGGITINMEQMEKVLHFSPEDMTITVQPGLTRKNLNKIIQKHGLQFPIDPGADASIGGMAATNASGTTAVRFGSMREQILDLEVVLADGRVIHTGSHAKKSSSGYHLSGMFIGSEGTLGIITEITLKLHGIPERTIAARCTFPTLEQCAEAAYTVLLHDVPVERMELVDAASIRQVNHYGDYTYPEAHSLFFEFAGTKSGAEAQAEMVANIMQDLKCAHWETATETKDINHLWRARHDMSLAFRHQKEKSFFGTDICVPFSKLPEMIGLARKLLKTSGLTGGILGHVGDGNFHTLILFNADDEAETQAADYVNDTLVNRALEVQGTCTGEHGVGLGKRKYQSKEHGEALGVMKDMKELLDPYHILNPGKIF